MIAGRDMEANLGKTGGRSELWKEEENRIKKGKPNIYCAGEVAPVTGWYSSALQCIRHIPSPSLIGHEV
jgi:hypothetical protein